MLRAIIVAYGIACAGDIASTQASLGRGNHEALLTQNNTVNAVIVAGGYAATSTGLWKLREHHPKLAWGLGIALTAVRTSIAIRNTRVGR